MKLSTKGRYGTRAMLDIALNCAKGSVLLKDIAKRQQISEGYLEHIIASLKTARLIDSTRGAKGGYFLLKNPRQITIAQIINCLEGLAPVECVDRPSVCKRNKTCVTKDLWAKMKNAIDEVIESTTLGDLVDQHRKKAQKKVAMYHI